ncbi:zinc-binding dehydrogenase [Pseudonocardia endophytica]|uniref:NADPH2:quinone reductase n=1 Tax=Pseudonocardia endophytica TaxID=401976 RepID=A0A4R1HY23_PSEEN|nr:zinc-binding dehydrogenase [Pseudonocardia endophytica]TCK26411.1 NADPH2:quinone reductase [Pseudonocardia endophytica]
MDAIVQEEFGPPDVLVARDVPDPAPGRGQVRVRVAAAGVHLVDTRLRAGEAGGPFGLPELPMVPGREVAGVVDAVGADTDPDWLGVRVSAHLGPAASGGYAELAVTDADALHRLPDHVSEVDAVAVLGTGRMTTGLLSLARPRTGELALVTSSAGGIGTLLVQWLVANGVDVVATAGSTARAASAHGTVATAGYSTPGWEARLAAELGDRRPSLVFDGVGGAVGRAAFDLLAPGGRIVLHGWSSGSATAFTSQDLYTTGRTAIVGLGPPILALGLRRLADEALDLLADGTFAPVTTRFPLVDAAGAHRALEERRTEGKVVLVP